MNVQVAVAVLFLAVGAAATAQTRPNIVIVLADDLGWNDVSFHGSSQIPTPNIDALAYNGIILNSHYVPALCTPSRSSLMTGKYPTHLGMQHLVILAAEPWGLPLSERLMPEYLRAAGYATHAIGKWHLGFCRKEYTPLYRGFDSHYGYYNGFQDYYDHSVQATYSTMKGYDMHRNMSIDWDARGVYSTDLFTNEAVRVIHDHDTKQGPLFMYLSHLAPHTGNQANPFQAPDEEIAKFAHIEDPERRVYAAMVSKVDQSVGEVMAALRSKGMLGNSIVVFMSDNGAPTFGIHSNRGSNWPLRGMKHTAMEGGVRGVAAIWSPLLNNTQRVSNQLMHMSDWLPTFYSAAGLNVADLGNIDGVDMWKALSDNQPSPRTEVVHNIDSLLNYASIRNGDWKYITGTTQGEKADQWFGDSSHDENEDPPTSKYNMDAVLQSKTETAILGLITELELKEKLKKSTETSENDTTKKDTQIYPIIKRGLLSKSTILALRKTAQIVCTQNTKANLTEDVLDMKIDEEERVEKPDTNNTDCKPTVSPCLFNIRNDPCETRNLAGFHVSVLQRMEAILERKKLTVVKPRNTPSDPNANPAYWNNTWISWLDDIEQELPMMVTSTYLPTLPLPPSASPVTVLTVVTAIFGVIILFLMGIILKLYFGRMPDPWSVFSISLPKDKKTQECTQQTNVG